MGDNLLVNGSFEGGTTHAATYWVKQDGPQHTEFGNINTPFGWVSWWKEQVVNSGSPSNQITGRPEVKVIGISPDPVRVYDGNKAVLMFGFWRNIRCGLYQVVEGITPGQKLRFSLFAHGWYSDCDFKPHDVPYKADCTTKAVDSHMRFRVGISPTGSEDPGVGGDVEWSDWAEVYGRYGPMLTFEAEAQSEKVSVFVWVETNYALKHCDAYFDKAILEVISEPTKPCKGLPRVQYERDYVLLPPSAGGEWVRAIGTVWDKKRFTIGASADDAGVGDLDVKRILAVNPAQWSDDLVQFYAQYYPGVEYKGIIAKSPADLAIRLTEPLTGDIAQAQQDLAWKNLDLGECPGGETIGQAGCLLVTLSMMLRKLYRVNVTPPVLNQLLKDDGVPFVQDDLLMWADAVKLFGCFTSSQKIDRAYTVVELKALLDNGWLVGLRRADGLHFVYLESVDGDVLNIIDSWDGKRKTWTVANVSGIRAARYTGEDEPDPPPDPPNPPNPPVLPLEGINLGYHGQVWGNWMHEINASAHMRVNKGLAGMQDFDSVHRAWDKTLFVWRHFGDQNAASTAPTPNDGAKIWLSYFRDGLTNYCNELEQRFPGIKPPYFYVESLNEMVATHDPKLSWFLELDRQFIIELRKAEPRVNAVVFCGAVGNPAEDEYSLLVPLGKTTQEYGALFGYHAYWCGDSTQSYMTKEHWPCLAGRWTEMDKVLVANGVKVKWFFGECGAVGGHPVQGGGYYLNPGSGWLDPNDCYGGNWLRYAEDLLKFSTWIEEWNVTHNNRALGGALFTTGADYTGWKWFQLQDAQWRPLAQTLIALKGG